MAYYIPVPENNPVIDPNQWVEVKSTPDHTLPIRSGVEARLDGDRKLYRAFCIYPSDMNKPRVESPAYEACDAADPNFNTGNYMRLHQKDIIIADAAIARFQMKENQRSLADMLKIADDLRALAVQEYNQWQIMEQERERMRVEDQDAIKIARTWLRGLHLLRENGTEEEKATVKALLGKK